MAAKGFTESTAQLYSHGRPGHSVELMCAALRSPHGFGPDGAAAAAPRGSMRIVDVGAGTGKSLKAVAEAASLVAPEAALELHAVEPSGLATEIAATVPGAHVHACEATALPFDDASVDLVSIGQALHWFAGVPALSEARRVLRPGGRLLLAWNTRDACSTVREGPGGVVQVDATDAALRAIEAGEPGAAGLPTAVETAVEYFYSPDVPRQQSGAWGRFARIDGPTMLLPASPPPGVAIEQPEDGPRMRSFGPFGRFPAGAFRAGAGVLACGGHLAEDEVAATALAASTGSVPAGSGEEAVFALGHFRSWGAMAVPAEDVVSNFRSVSVVAAGDAERRDKACEALRSVMERTPAVVATDGGGRLHVLPLMQDVFVGSPIVE